VSSTRSNGTDGVGTRQGSTGRIERERVLVTEDIDTFVGFDDRDYDLAAGDVVTLPETNAELLVERDAARRL
jgi:DNA replication factor GINS